MKWKVLDTQVHAGPTALSVRVRGPDISRGLSQSAQRHSILVLAMIDTTVSTHAWKCVLLSLTSLTKLNFLFDNESAFCVFIAQGTTSLVMETEGLAARVNTHILVWLLGNVGGEKSKKRYCFPVSQVIRASALDLTSAWETGIPITVGLCGSHTHPFFCKACQIQRQSLQRATTSQISAGLKFCLRSHFSFFFS